MFHELDYAFTNHTPGISIAGGNKVTYGKVDTYGLAFGNTMLNRSLNNYWCINCSGNNANIKIKIGVISSDFDFNNPNNPNNASAMWMFKE